MEIIETFKMVLLGVTEEVVGKKLVKLWQKENVLWLEEMEVVMGKQEVHTRYILRKTLGWNILEQMQGKENI